VEAVIPLIAGCLFVGALFSVAATANSAHTSKASCKFDSRHYWGVGPNYVRVDKGAFDGNCWTLWMKGGHQKRCYNLGIAGDQRIAGARGCDLRARRPRASGWRQVLGATTGRQGGMVVMQITGRQVRYLRTRAGPGRPQRRIHQPTKRISRREARRAHLRRNFRFAVARSPRPLCIRHVVAFDRHRVPIGRFRRPCKL
jgi:hypothetical protein